MVVDSTSFRMVKNGRTWLINGKWRGGSPGFRLATTVWLAYPFVPITYGFSIAYIMLCVGVGMLN
jgi:hypothetical protein